MKTRYALFALVMIITAAYIGFQVTHSFFSDTGSSTNNVFAAATLFPTPTPTTPPIAQVLVINEVLPDSSCSQGQTEAQWFELYNGFSTSVNLKNFKITDGTNTIDLVTSNTTLPAGGLILLAHSTAIFGSGKCYNDNGVDVANLGGQLNIDSKNLTLLDANSNIIDVVKWGPTGTDSYGQPLWNPLQNQSIERNPKGLDSATSNTFNSADFVVRTTPRPGL